MRSVRSLDDLHRAPDLPRDTRLAPGSQGLRFPYSVISEMINERRFPHIGHPDYHDSASNEFIRSLGIVSEVFDDLHGVCTRGRAGEEDGAVGIETSDFLFCLNIHVLACIPYDYQATSHTH